MKIHPDHKANDSLTSQLSPRSPHPGPDLKTRRISVDLNKEIQFKKSSFLQDNLCKRVMVVMLSGTCIVDIKPPRTTKQSLASKLNSDQLAKFLQTLVL